MTAKQIDNSLLALGRYPGRRMHGFCDGDPDLASFVVHYKDLGVAWYLASEFARRQKSLPIVCTGANQWLFRAWSYCNGERDRSVAHARALGTEPALREEAAVIQSMLIAKDSEIHKIAMTLGIPADVIQAYEQLFFNVFDRQEEYLYIRNIVYPNGRLVEMFDNYIENETMANLLLRAGFNHGMEEVLNLSGVTRGNLFTGGDGASVLAGMLESMFMNNGLMMARAGFVNQRSNAEGLRQAAKILTATKASGVAADTSSPISNKDPNDPLLMQVLQFAKSERRRRAEAEVARAMAHDAVVLESSTSPN